ncbi:hypothetical protein [Streptomyces sp. NPDC050534]|uniref:hypothetical protein n=1 Tax=Streptomyces sp. NPDC050534 TaxID=3365625 RepID=UPI0037BC83DB
MRLRQAHAILETATALEAAGIGFELFPFDHDRDDLVRPPADDYMTGYAEFNDPDHGDSHTRTYHINIEPHPDGRRISATLTFGYGNDAPCLKCEAVTVWMEHDEAENPSFRGLVGAGLANRIADAVREHEKPFRAAYEERSNR